MLRSENKQHPQYSIFRRASIDKAALDKNYDTVILVFDFEYDGEIKKTDLPVQFDRAVPYEKG